MGIVAAILVMLVAVPVAMALATTPVSSSTYSFGASGQGAAGKWIATATTQTVSITATPSADTTVSVTFELNSHATTWTATALGTKTATFRVPAVEGSNEINYWASETTPTGHPVTVEDTNGPFYINFDTIAPTFAYTSGLTDTDTKSWAADWSSEVTRTVSLTGTDNDRGDAEVTDVSGVQKILRSVNGGATVTATETVLWDSESAPVPFTLVKGTGGVVEGSNAITYSVWDWAGNHEATQTAYVNIDTIAPVTTSKPALAADAVTGWRKTALWVGLSWADASSGVAQGNPNAAPRSRFAKGPLDNTSATWYSIDGGANFWQYTTPFMVSWEGSTAVQYYSNDRAWNAEDPQLGFINIDSTKPTTSAKAASGKHGKKISLKYRVQDALAEMLMAKNVTLKIKNPKGKVIKTVKISGEKAMGTWFTYKWKAPKAKGTYKYSVYAQDLAGNSQSKVATAKIKVK